MSTKLRESTFRHWRRPTWSAFLLLLVLTLPIAAAEVVTVSGHGEAAVAPAKKKEAAAAANQQALAGAEQKAKEDAVAQAVFQVYGNRQKLGAQADSILRDTANHSAAMILEKQVTSADIQNGTAVVEVVLKVDGAALREYLEGSLGLALSIETEGKFKVYVLSYTVEGVDPDHSKPQVLQEEVTEDRRDVQDYKHSESAMAASSSSDRASLDAAAASSSRGSASQSASGSLQASGSYSQGAAAGAYAAGSRQGKNSSSSGVAAAGAVSYAQGQAAVRASGSSSSAAAWDQRKAASLSARESHDSASLQQSASATAAFNDQSTYYHRFTVYADTTKKGAGTTNEIRAKLEEMLKSSGFVTGFYDVNLMGREYGNEDEICHDILTEVKKNPDVSADDFVAIALNRFTPVEGASHRYTSQVTYRVIKVKNGESLLPPKNVIGDSGDQATDDVGRTISTEVALQKADEILPGEISKAVKQSQRMEARSAQAASTTYLIRLDNVSSPLASTQMKQALRGSGFSVTTQFRGEAKSETVSVTLNGKTGDDVMATIEPFLGSFDVVTMDDKNTVLKAKAQ